MEEDQSFEKEIKNVWSQSFEKDFNLFEDDVKMFPIVAMDTEFAGMLDKSATKNNFDLYTQMRSNVIQTKCIQVGFALSNESGEVCSTIWQFNLRFDVNTDVSDPKAIEKLTESGIEFDMHAKQGIDGFEFSKVLLQSRLLKFNPGSDDITWVTYHGCYDFLHFIKVCLQGENSPDLPESLTDFYDMMCSFICKNTYDVKMLGAYNNPAYYGSLDGLVTSLELERLGTSHQAGSDAYVTLLAYLILKDSSRIDCRGLLFGLFHDFDDI